MTSSAVPIAVVTADNHLRPTTWVQHPTLAGDAYVAWQQIYEYAASNRLPLIQLGDLFDNARPDPESVSRYLAGMQVLQAGNVPFLFIQGNHDRIVNPAWADLSPWATRAEGVFTLAGIRFYGISYKTKTELANELSRIPADTQVVLAHQAWKEIQNAGVTDASLCDFPFGVLLLTGDYHVKGTYSGVARDGQAVTAYSPGSTAMQALNEPPDKYFGVLYSDLRIQWIRLLTRSYITVDVSTEAEFESLLPRLRQPYDQSWLATLPMLQKAIVRVRYSTTIPNAYERLIQAAGDQFHLFLVPIGTVQNTIAVPEQVTQGVSHLEQAAVGLANLTVDEFTPATVDLVRALLTTSSLREVYTDQFDRFVNQS